MECQMSKSHGATERENDGNREGKTSTPLSGRLDPEALWQEMEVDPTPGEGWMSRRLIASRPVNLFCALQRPENLPALLLEVETRALLVGEEPPATRGFSLRVERLQPGPLGTVRIALVLQELAWREVFCALVKDIASAILSQSTPVMQVRSLYERLHLWRRFMEKRGPDGLTVEGQLGLFAELVALEQICLAHMPVLAAVRSWEGPSGALHDFAMPLGAMEIKGTSRLPVTAFEVHHLQQLDETGLQRLALGLVSLEVGSTVMGMTLPERIEKLSSQLARESSEAAALFEEHLRSVGYLHEQAHRYRTRRYLLRDLYIFEVRDGFPRLRVADVPSGVMDCQYVVSMLACQPFRISLESLTRRWIGALNG